ncbi:MAG TPA: DUF2807 domain-containing protein [Bacteroidales bacterium]|nr:DUF2807 domain-containing protein [Bacteroidales bacterium]
MKRVIHIGIFTCVMLVLLLLVGCQDTFNECLKGKGATVTERIGLYPFGNVVVYDNLELTLAQGNEYMVQITAGENIIPMLGINIENNTLLLSNESSCLLLTDPWKPIKVVVTAPQFDTLTIRSHAGVYTQLPIKQDKFSIRLNKSVAKVEVEVDCEKLAIEYFDGTADVTIRGRAYRANCYHAGVGRLDLTQLHSVYMNMGAESRNDCRVRGGDEYFFVSLRDIGNVYYTNDPQHIELFLESSGQLIKSNE